MCDGQRFKWKSEKRAPVHMSGHPAVVFFSDILWDGIIKYHFLRGRIYFLVSFSVFLAAGLGMWLTRWLGFILPLLFPTFF